MRDLNSLIMAQGDVHKVPAGSALAVDRDGFAEGVTAAIGAHPNIELVRERIDSLPEGPAIIATGPLTGASLAEAVRSETGEDALAFFDAIAPIVHRDSIDMDVCWMAARWDKGGKDYINCPMDKAQYDAFIAALNTGLITPGEYYVDEGTYQLSEAGMSADSWIIKRKQSRSCSTPTRASHRRNSWMNPEALPQWWGPDGFSCRTQLDDLAGVQALHLAQLLAGQADSAHFVSRAAIR